MKNLLSMTAILGASFCFAGVIANERTETAYVPNDHVTNLVKDQDTSMNRQAPMNNRKRDMGDTSRQVRPDRRTDTTNMRSVPMDAPPESMPKRKM